MQFNKNPPITNRGVLRKKKGLKNMQNNGLNSRDFEDLKTLRYPPHLDYLIDWVQVTFKDIKLKDLLQIFGINMDDTYFCSKGLFGYTHTYIYKEKIKFMTSNNIDMGIHLMLSGKGCREWEEHINDSWTTLFNVIWSTRSKVTRIDIAIDSFTRKYFTTKKVIHAIRNKTVSSRCLYCINTEKIYLNDVKIKGHSIKFGNSASEVSLIFYDKLQERKQASYDVDDSIKIWERMELRLRGSTANNLIQNYFSNNWTMNIDFVKGILLNYINFKTLTGCETIRKRDNIKWWQDLINDITPLQLSQKAIQSTIQRKKSWVDLSVSKTLAMLYLADIEGLQNNEILSYITTGLSKFKAHDLESINAYRIEKGASIISDIDYLKLKNKLLNSISVEFINLQE